MNHDKSSHYLSDLIVLQRLSGGPKASFSNRRGSVINPKVCVAIALALTATACQSSPSSSDPANGLKIGSLLPITGDLARYGSAMQDTVNLLRDTVNACDGVLGQPVEVIPGDTQSEPSAGASVMTQLAEVDQVSSVIGAARSSVSTASVDISVRNSIVQISPSSTGPVFTERAKAGEFNGFWFRTAPPDTFQGIALAQLAQERDFETVAVLAVNDEYGTGLVEAFTNAYQKMGGEIANEKGPTFYASTSTIFDSEVTTAFKSDPDAVLIVSFPETGSLILKAAFEQGLLDGNTQIILTDGMKNLSIVDDVGQTADGDIIVSGVIGTAPSAGGPALDDFTARYKSVFDDRDPEVFDPNTWDAAAVLVLAAEAAQSTEGEAIKANIVNVANAPGTEVTNVCEGLALVREGQDINYQGASSTVEFDAQGDVVGRYDVWTITETGALEVIETVDVGG